VPNREIRARHDANTITVYQAYNSTIAEAAVATQRLDASPGFKHGRMTWIKPSWAWMMYRSGYSYKDPGQSRILALKMQRQHFLHLLEGAILADHARSQPSTELATSEQDRSTTARVQWDPERTPKLEVLPYRSIQIGIPRGLVSIWSREWIESIEDVTPMARSLHEAIQEDPGVTYDELLSRDLLPLESAFPVPDNIRQRLNMDAES
jgi:hypothetical protein